MNKLTIDIISFLIFIAIGHGFLLGFVFIFHKNWNRKLNRYFGFLLFSFSLSIFYGILLQTGLYKIYPHLNRIGYPFQLLIGPLLYFYIATFTGKRVKLKYIHYLPFALLTILMVPYFKLPGSQKVFFIENPGTINSFFPFIVVEVLIQIQLWFYLVKSFFLLNVHIKNAKANYSSLKDINLSWVRTIILQVAFTFFILLVDLFSVNILNKKSFLVDYRIIPLLVSLFIYIAGYKALVQKEILHFEPPPIAPQKELKPINETILKFMEENKPYLISDITLPELASSLGMTRNQLSSSISNSEFENFFDFINRYRVEEVKRYLQDPSKDQLTLLAISQECGFNSKATFNNVFKKITGMTPSYYKKNRSL